MTVDGKSNIRALSLLLFISLAVSGCGKQNNTPMDKTKSKVRPPAVAGQFYPADSGQLRQKIENFLKHIKPEDASAKVQAIIVPHAGYDYSGLVAANAYARLRGRTAGTVVIIGNSHTGYFDGLAVDDSDAWDTTLGTVAVDKELAEKLAGYDKTINLNSQVHAGDHSLEVQLPFLETVLAGEFKIVPILFGNTGGNEYGILARALSENLGANDLVVVSSDLSHYPAYDDARQIDTVTLERISALDIPGLENHIENTMKNEIDGEETLCCGIDGVKTLLALAKSKNWQGRVLNYANSGDTIIGDKTRVVGYGAVVFDANTDSERSTGELTLAEQETLLHIARRSVEEYVREGALPEFEIKSPGLLEREGAFVTLHKNDKLRGCIGQIIPSNKPLWQVVRDMAIAAASEDNRFEPVAKDELKELTYEVSVLSVPTPIEDWHKIELGKHGVIVKKGRQAGVFLPQVADETGWDLDEFLAQLCAQKAGLPPEAYKSDPELELLTFTAQVLK